jgi:hypothetical protein
VVPSALVVVVRARLMLVRCARSGSRPAFVRDWVAVAAELQGSVTLSDRRAPPSPLKDSVSKVWPASQSESFCESSPALSLRGTLRVPEEVLSPSMPRKNVWLDSVIFPGDVPVRVSTWP